MYFKKPIQLRLLSYLFRSAPEITDKQLRQHIGRVPMVGTYEGHWVSGNGNKPV